MAFPDDRMPIRLRAAFGADAGASPTTWPWTDITHAVNAQQVTITRGEPNEGSEPAPTSMSIVLDNPDGDFTPDNALSPYYPDIDLGVPIEYSIGGGTPFLRLEAGGRATTPDTAALDITGDVDVRLDIALDTWQAEPAFRLELCGKYDFSSGDERAWLLLLSASSEPVFRWSPDGAALTEVTATAPLAVRPAGRLALRVTLDVDNGAGGHTVTFYTAPTLAGPWEQLGDAVTGTGTTSIFNSTAPLTAGDIAFLGFNSPVGDYYGMQVRNGIDGTLAADIDFTAQTEGATSFPDTTGLTWTLANRAEITAWRRRFIGHADSWEPVWPYGDLSEQDEDGTVVYAGESQVTVTASGLLRRLGQGEDALQSTLRRRIPSFAPVAYWPGEDGREATQWYSPVDGVRPLAMSGLDMAAVDTLAGSSPLPAIRTGATLSGTVPPPAAASTSWHTEFVAYIDSAQATARTVLQWLSTGTVARWRLMVYADGAEIRGYDSDGNQTISHLVAVPQIFGNWFRWQLYATQNGANVDYIIRWVIIGAVGLQIGGSYAGTLGRISGVANAGTYSSDLDGASIGHIAVFTLANTLAYNEADHGFNGERAATRMTRLCREEGIAFGVGGLAADTEPMGPQRPATLTSLLTDAARVDGGILGEQRTAYGLQYRTRTSLYNQSPALVLDAANNEITNPFAPVRDDQRLRNDVTVFRDGGSAARAMDEASILRRRRYATSIPVNAYTDDQLASLAGWRLHLGTWPGMRYPSLAAELAIAPQLIPAWLGMDYGDRLQVTNLPPQHPADTVDLLLQGYSETISPTRWSIHANCGTAGPWNVGVVADSDTGTADAPTPSRTDATPGASTLVLAADAGTTQLLVHTPAPGALPPRPWITSLDRLTANPDFEQDLTGWTATGGTIERVATLRPAPFSGDWSLRLTPDGATAIVSAASARVPVTPGAVYAVHGWLRCATSRLVNLNVNWFDAGDVYITTTVTSQNVEADTWTRFTGSHTAPAGAATAEILPTMAGTPPTTDVLHADVVFLGSASPPPGAYARDFPYDLRLGGEVVRVTANAPALYDSFGRTVADGWGTSDTGQAWSVVGDAADYSVGSGYGSVAQPAVGIAHLTLTPAPSADVDLYVDVATSVLAAGASLFAGPIVRTVSNADWYGARLDFTTTAGIVLTMRKRVADVESQLASFTSRLTHVAGTFYRVRFQAAGSTLRAKVWKATAAEPQQWHIEVTDTALTAAASVGTRSFANTGSTAVNPSMRFDNFHIVTPQRMTVIRSVNGVPKAHQAGAEVRVNDPAVIAL